MAVFLFVAVFLLIAVFLFMAVFPLIRIPEIAKNGRQKLSKIS
jgi:hypothetical protein